MTDNTNNVMRALKEFAPKPRQSLQPSQMTQQSLMNPAVNPWGGAMVVADSMNQQADNIRYQTMREQYQQLLQEELAKEQERQLQLIARKEAHDINKLAQEQAHDLDKQNREHQMRLILAQAGITEDPIVNMIMAQMGTSVSPNEQNREMLNNALIQRGGQSMLPPPTPPVQQNIPVQTQQPTVPLTSSLPRIGNPEEGAIFSEEERLKRADLSSSVGRLLRNILGN